VQSSVRTAHLPPTIELKAQQIAAHTRTKTEMRLVDTMSSLRGHTLENYYARRFVSSLEELFTQHFCWAPRTSAH
jgi:hypothetical protein